MAPTAFQGRGHRTVIPQRTVPAPVEPPPERLPGLPVIAEQRADVVKLVGRDDQLHLAGQVCDAANVRLLARAPGPLRKRKTIAARPHIRGHIAAQTRFNGLQGRMPALVLGRIVQQGGRHLPVAPPVLAHQRRYRKKMIQIRDLRALAHLFAVQRLGKTERLDNQ